MAKVPAQFAKNAKSKKAKHAGNLKVAHECTCGDKKKGGKSAPPWMKKK